MTSKGSRVLVVDDSPAIRAVLRTALELDGRLELAGEAHNGAEGIELAEQLVPDGVVLDVHMPVMGGFEALPKVRALLPDAVIVVWSSGTDEGAEHALELGATAYLTKATSPTALVDSLALHVGRTLRPAR